MKFTVDELSQFLPMPANEKWTDGVWDFEAFKNDGARLVFFAPRGVDRQTVHDDDEFYFIARGSGEIVIGPERFDFVAGDAFFVPAGTVHRFENFSTDLATWAVFF